MSVKLRSHQKRQGSIQSQRIDIDIAIRHEPLRHMNIYLYSTSQKFGQTFDWYCINILVLSVKFDPFMYGQCYIV